MTDEEFDVLDELYFVIKYGDLLEETGLPSEQLIQVLQSLYSKGWIKIMETVDDELSASEIDLKNSAGSYFFLATKSGLLAHNT